MREPCPETAEKGVWLMPPKAQEAFDGFINLDGEKVHVSDAERVSKDILKRLPQRSDQWNLLRQLAMYCWQEGLYDASCVYLRQILAVADDPSVKSDCYLKLGQVREAADDYLEALRNCEEAFDLDLGRTDTSYFLHNNRGFCLNQLGRYGEAETYCRKAIEINGERYNAYSVWPCRDKASTRMRPPASFRRQRYSRPTIGPFNIWRRFWRLIGRTSRGRFRTLRSFWCVGWRSGRD